MVYRADACVDNKPAPEQWHSTGQTPHARSYRNILAQCTNPCLDCRPEVITCASWQSSSKGVSEHLCSSMAQRQIAGIAQIPKALAHQGQALTLLQLHPQSLLQLSVGRQAAVVINLSNGAF